jgi:hypothetical protein
MFLQGRTAGLAFVLIFGSVLSAFADGIPRDGSAAPSAPPLGYQVQAGLDGEIYPVFANYASLQKHEQRLFGVVTVTISNPAAIALRQRVAVQVPGWSDREIQIAEIGPGSAQTLIFAPSFLARFYQNHEITVPVRLRSSEDIYWGQGFKYASFIASWVKPHDPLVEAALAQAKQYTADHRLPGYEDWKKAAEQEQETYREAKAIYTALQRMGLSYVKSSLTLGGHQSLSERVRMPEVSLRQSSMNCIDAAVMYASLFENLGMDAKVIIVPGHAYVGVRVAPGSARFLLIDGALTGRATFAAAVSSAQSGLARRDPSSVTQVVIGEARSAGIYPMP